MKRKILMQCMLWLGLAMISYGSITEFVIPFIDNVRIKKISKELTDRYGLVVCYGDPSEFRVPPFKAITENEELHIEKADKHYVLTALKGIKSALFKYPPTLIRKYLSAVFVAGIIKGKEVYAAGTYHNSWIYISTSGKDPLNPNKYSETFHHELSSLFLKGPLSKSLPREQSTLFAYSPYSTPIYDPGVEPIKAPKFPLERWSRTNKTNFKYPEQDSEYIRTVKNFRKPEEAPSWYKAGFVDDYGMSSLENDVNTYAEIAMVHPEKLKKLAEQYPRIEAKTKIFVEFYASLAPELRDYFKSVGLSNEKQ